MSGPSAESDAGWPDPNNWPTNAEFVAMVKSVPADFPLCDCGVQDGMSEATNPDDRSEVLPHHFDCSAVSAWAAIRSWVGARLEIAALAIEAEDDLESRVGHAAFTTAAALVRAEATRVLSPEATTP